MEKIKKKQIILFLIVFGIFGIGLNALAVFEVNWPVSPLGTELQEDSLTILVKYLYEWGISLGGFAAFIALVIAGFRYLTSAGDPAKMKEAMSSIRSAALGLALLLASVLILNTINPQLTQLRPPEISTEFGQLAPTTIYVKQLTLEQCGGANLYPGTKFQGTPTSLGPQKWEINAPITVGSVEILGGSCQVKLYLLANFKENADYPATSVSYNTPVLEGGITNFRSVKLIDLYPPK